MPTSVVALTNVLPLIGARDICNLETGFGFITLSGELEEGGGSYADGRNLPLGVEPERHRRGLPRKSELDSQADL